MILPSFDDIHSLHRKYALSEKVLDIVWKHSLIIKEIAEEIMAKKQLELGRSLVIAGALIHDIGAYKVINTEGEVDGQNYIRHGVEGFAILKAENYPQALCTITIHHTGVGISKEDVLSQHLPLPPQNYLAETLEEKLIMYADKFHSKTPKFNTFASYAEYVKKYGEDKIEKFEKLAELFGVPDLEPLAEKYHHPLI